MVLLLLACAAPDPELARMARMRDTLRDDNLVWLSRDPGQLEAKFARMAGDPYDFLRGSAAWYWSELARPDPERAPTPFLTDPEALTVLLAGDLHLENAGTCLPGAEPDPGTADPDAALVYEAVDLDGAGFGPWTLDTRRTALSLALLADGLDGCDATCVDLVVVRFAEAYVDEITRRAAGEGAWDSSDLVDAGRITADLELRARADGSTQAELADTTEIVGEERRFALDAALDASGEGLLALSPEEDAQLARLLDRWGQAPAGFRYLAGARRYGAGVASLPAIRYAVLWDTGSAAWADDRLLNVREVVDPPHLPGVDAGLGSTWDSLAARVEALPDVVWSRPDADVRYGAVEDGAQTFKITSWSGWFQEVDHGSVASDWLTGEVGEPDLGDFAATLGRLLAGVHARGPTGAHPDTPGRGLDVVARDLSGREDAFVEERRRDAPADVSRLRADHAAFVHLREVYGPLLGIDAVAAE